MNDAHRQVLLDTLLGNQAAAEFCEDICYCSDLWDDQIDGDRAHTDAEVNDGWWRALVKIPRNPFYRQHFDVLNPVVMITISDWLTANQFEREEGACVDKLATAYALKSQYVNVIVMCAIVIGGADYGLRMAPAIREFCHSESFVDYRLSVRKGTDHV